MGDIRAFYSIPNFMDTLLRFFLTVLIGFTFTFTVCRADPVLEDVIEKSYPMAATAKLTIRNTDGSIRVYGAEINQIKIEAIKKAYSEDRLRQISIDISAGTAEILIDTK